MVRTVVILLLALLSLSSANSANISASFQHLSGTHWAVDLETSNDGDPPVITGFTIYFPAALFSSLSVANSPAQWDSIVIQPDLGLASPGFFDSFITNPGSALLPGQTATGFRVEVQFLGIGSPPMLQFEIVDQNFNVQFTGLTSAPIPEPTTLALLLAGIVCVLVRTRKRHTRQ